MAEANPDPEYKCLMCMKPYNEPRELPCGHTFCYQCLTSYIDKEHVTADEDRHYFPCPVCDTPISPRDVSLNVRNWATSFPINNLFLSSTAQRSNDRVCGACLRDNETSAGEAWCADCAEILCKQCRAVHGRIKVTAKHRLVPVGENVGGFYDMMVNGVCSNHDEKPLEIYCLDHTAMCCSVCVSLSHRSCNHVKSLRDVIEKTMTDRSSHETEWEDITDESKKMLDEEDAGFTFLVSKEKAVSAEMTNRIQQAKDKLDDLNTTFQSDLAEKCNEHRKQLSPRRNHVNTFHINAENSNMLMTRLEKQCSDRDRFIMREKTKNQISAHYRRLDQNTKNQPSRFEITLKLGTIIDEIMKVTSAGNADVTSTESSISQNANVRIQTLLGALLSTPSVTTFANSTSASDIAGSLQHMTVQSAPVTEPVDVWTGSVSCVHSLNASALGGSNSCLLNGGIFTDNGELLMTDCNNSRLLLFDDMYSFQKEYIFDSGKPPVDIARGSTADEIFVAFQDDDIVRCTLRDGQLSVINTIRGPLQTCGIAVIADSILVATADSVKDMSMDGNVTRLIQTPAIRRAYPCLAVSTSKGTLYHNDKNGVMCRQLDSGAIVYRYKATSMTHNRGISLDGDDNLYVCGSGSSNVHLFSSDGSRWRILLAKLLTIRDPCCLVVHPTKQEFVVSSLFGSTSLEVYRFRNVNN